MPYTNTEVITFENGIQETLEPSRLADGFATEILNWQPEPDGSLRIRLAWQKASEDASKPAAIETKGLIYMPKYAVAAGDFDPAYVFANKVAAGEYEMYALRKSLLTAGAYLKFDDWVVTDASHHVPMAVGLGYLFYTNAEQTLVRRWDGLDAGGVAPADIAGSKGGRALLVYKQRLLSIGNAAEPWKLFFTALNDPTDWAGTDAGNVPVGSDDGDTGNAMIALENGVLIGKDDTCWFLLGTNPTNFQLVQLNSGDAAPGNSMVKTPVGTVICGSQDVWLFAGGQPVPISRGIGSSYGVAADGFVTAAYVDGKVHVAIHDEPEHFTYDIETQAWTKETYADEAGRPGVLLGQEEYLLGGIYDAAAGPPIFYRRSPAGDREVDAAGSTYEATTPELWLNGSAGPFTMRRIVLRLRQRGGDAAQAPLEIRHLMEGQEVHYDEVKPFEGPGVYRQEVSLGGTGYFTQLNFRQEVAAGQQAAFDIEDVEIVFDTEKKRGGRGGGGPTVIV